MNSAEALALKIPGPTMGALQRYLDHGIMPGGFLTAVLQNDLKESMYRADDGNRAALAHLVRYLYNYVPMAAWGSPERVMEWVGKFRYASATDQQ